MFIYLNKRGQSTLEYGVVIAVIVAALIAMQTYIRRGMHGKLRESTDDIGKQFSPEHTTSNYTTTSGSTSQETVTTAGRTTTQVTRGFQNVTGNETVEDLANEDWPR